MRQIWRDLLFLHFPLDPNVLAPLVPPGLDLDLFPDADGELKAWLGIVVFGIEGIRLGMIPPIPGLQGFAEANVRTYVHRQGNDPSVLFLSLDGGPWLTRTAARISYGVPYVRARTSLESADNERHFFSQRRDGTTANFHYRPGNPIPTPEAASLDFFLLERYMLLAPTENGVKRARVWHRPYRPYHVDFEGNTDLPEAHGIAGRPFVHAAYCDDVHAEFFAPERLP